MNMFKTTKQNEEWWKKRKINWETHYFTPNHKHRKLLVDILKTSPPRNVLEIGCGCGANLYAIKRAFPDVNIAGCDINKDAIETAKRMFENAEFTGKKTDYSNYKENPRRKDFKELAGGAYYKEPAIPEIEFKVGNIDAIPFHGESYDLVLTDACLIYIGPDKIRRALREIKRVGYNNMMFVEFHSNSWLKRSALRVVSGYYAYNYQELLERYYFKHIKIHKIPKEVWPGKPWQEFGVVITCVR